VPKSFCQKITNPNCKHIKAAQKLSYKKVARKILVNLTPGCLDWAKFHHLGYYLKAQANFSVEI
jgi:hypothetical protein